MANSYLVWAHVCPDVSSRSGLDAVYLSIEKKMFPARMLKEVTACREVGESRLHKRFGSTSSCFIFQWGLFLSLEADTGNSYVPLSQMCGCFPDQASGMIP